MILKSMSNAEEGDGARLFFTMSGLILSGLNEFPTYYKPEPGSSPCWAAYDPEGSPQGQTAAPL